MFDQYSIQVVLLLTLAAVITYYDVRYRRIPNMCVLITLICGLTMNSVSGGWRGALTSLAGCAVAFCLMLLLHLFGALGAGDVKLFASIGAVIGLSLALPTFLVVLVTGGALAVVSILRDGTLVETAQRVSFIFTSLLISWRVPRFVMPTDQRKTIPYGVAITFGSLISLAIFRN